MASRKRVVTPEMLKNDGELLDKLAGKFKSLAALADHIGVSRGTVYGWRRKGLPVSMAILLHYAYGLGQEQAAEAFRGVVGLKG